MVRTRLKILIVLLCAPFLAILGRLGSLQLVADVRDEYLRLAEHRSRSFTSPLRGRILARDGRTVLAGNQPICQLQFQYSFSDTREWPRSLNLREEPLIILLDELEKRPGAPDRKEIEQRILELARPDVLAAPDADDDDEDDAPATGSAKDWVLLLENVDPIAGASLERRWKRFPSVFEARRSATSASWEVWFQPRNAARMEITLWRIHLLLERAGSARSLPRKSESFPDLVQRVAAVLTTIAGRAEREVQGDIDQHAPEALVARKALDVRRYYYAQSWLLLPEIPRQLVTEIEYRPWRFPGVACVDSLRRVYPLKEACGTIVGFLHRLDQADEKRLEAKGQLLDTPSAFESLEEFSERREGGALRTDLVGEGGLEQIYDEKLRGLHGMVAVRLNGRGRPSDAIAEIPAVDGEDIRTTIDAELQQIIYAALERSVRPAAGPNGGAAASAAVLDVETGALLASVGVPGLDSNRMLDGAYHEELASRWKGQVITWLLDRPSSIPLFPGSVFKTFVAAAAMESSHPWEGDYSPDRRYLCHHKFELIPSLTCDSLNGHRPDGVALAEALQYSCNNYFYYVGLKHLGSDAMASWAANFGYGRASGVDLPVSRGSAGTLMGADRASIPWQVCHYSIGQGMVEATPLQVLRSYAALAVGGRFVPKPFLVEPTEPDRLVLQNPRTVEVIRDGLWRVGHAPGGTAAKPELGLCRFNAAYKTGTAEVKRGNQMLNHGWLAGFAPFDKPRIAFVAVVEETPFHGAEVAGPIVEQILGHFAKEAPALYLLDPKKELHREAR